VKAFRNELDGHCLRPERLVGYRCLGGTPTLVAGIMGEDPAEYLGGHYARSVPALPTDARPLAAPDRGGPGRVYRSGTNPDAVFVTGRGGGVRRWPRLRRFSGQGGDSIEAFEQPSAFFIGDSITLGVEPLVEHVMTAWQLRFDAVIGRDTIGGLTALEQHVSEIGTWDVAVVGLGTNDETEVAQGPDGRWQLGAFRSRVERIMQLLAEVPVVVWIDVHQSRPGDSAIDDVIHSVVHRSTNGVIASWNRRAPVDGFGDDGIHPNAIGQDALAALIRRVVTRSFEMTIRGNSSCRSSLVAGLEGAQH
jgi:lysophospholipase L1-like esterase